MMRRLPAPPGADGPLPVLPPVKYRRELREKMGIRQYEAANELKVSQNSYGFWERGERTPAPEHLRAYYEQLYRWQRAIEGVSL